VTTEFYDEDVTNFRQCLSDLSGIDALAKVADVITPVMSGLVKALHFELIRKHQNPPVSTGEGEELSGTPVSVLPLRISFDDPEIVKNLSAPLATDFDHIVSRARKASDPRLIQQATFIRDLYLSVEAVCTFKVEVDSVSHDVSKRGLTQTRAKAVAKISVHLLGLDTKPDPHGLFTPLATSNLTHCDVLDGIIDASAHLSDTLRLSRRVVDDAVSMFQLDAVALVEMVRGWIPTGYVPEAEGILADDALVTQILAVTPQALGQIAQAAKALEEYEANASKLNCPNMATLMGPQHLGLVHGESERSFCFVMAFFSRSNKSCRRCPMCSYALQRSKQ
jgi:hypothetical protein